MKTFACFVAIFSSSLPASSLRIPQLPAALELVASSISGLLEIRRYLLRVLFRRILRFRVDIRIPYILRLACGAHLSKALAQHVTACRSSQVPRAYRNPDTSKRTASGSRTCATEDPPLLGKVREHRVLAMLEALPTHAVAAALIATIHARLTDKKEHGQLWWPLRNLRIRMNDHCHEHLTCFCCVGSTARSSGRIVGHNSREASLWSGVGTPNISTRLLCTLAPTANCLSGMFLLCTDRLDPSSQSEESKGNVPAHCRRETDIGLRLADPAMRVAL